MYGLNYCFIEFYSINQNKLNCDLVVDKVFLFCYAVFKQLKGPTTQRNGPGLGPGETPGAKSPFGRANSWGKGLAQG